MTPVRETSCNLQLDCFLRIYTGRHKPISGTELLLEPIAVSGATRSPSAGRGRSPRQLSPRPPELSTVETQTQTEEAEKGVPQEVSASASPPVSLPVRSSSSRPPDSNSVGVFFDEEVRVESTAQPQEQAPKAETAEEVPPSPATGLKEGAVRGLGPPEVPSSLPLVSELVRELYQIRAVKT
mmetsp:Transcript_5015/g.8965  ORF Transcript_5015/g.8965 Transcript_5015/m.8965 type:complete len:182 (-) Transcript_5015:51-596(-)